MYCGLEIDWSWSRSNLVKRKRFVKSTIPWKWIGSVDCVNSILPTVSLSHFGKYSSKSRQGTLASFEPTFAVNSFIASKDRIRHEIARPKHIEHSLSR